MQQPNLFNSLPSSMHGKRAMIPVQTSLDTSDEIKLGELPDTEERPILKNVLHRGSITVLNAAKNTGKTFIECFIASQVSNGAMWFDGTKADKEHVILINVEDSDRTIKERLQNHNADFTHIHYYRTITVNNPASSQTTGKTTISLPRDLTWLDEKIKGHGASLVIIDSVSRVLHNADKNQYVSEQIMTPLVEMALSNDVAILLINHTRGLTKHKGDNSMSHSNLDADIAYAKSIQDAARITFYMYKDDGNPKLRLMRWRKNNLGPDDLHPLQWTLHTNHDGITKVVFINEDNTALLAANTAIASIQQDNPCATPYDTEISIMELCFNEYVNQTMVIQRFIGYTGRLHLISTIGKLIKENKLERDHNGYLVCTKWVKDQYTAWLQSQNTVNGTANTMLIP